MTIVLSTAPYQQFYDANGNPLSGGKIYTYIAGTLTPTATYTDQGGGTPCANPIILDSAGRGEWWLDTGVSYKYIVKDSLDNTIDTIDNVTPFSTNASSTATIAANTILGNNTGATIAPLALTVAQVNTMLGSNAMILLATTNASGAASVAFSSTYITNAYNKYVVEFDGVYFPTGSNLYLTVSTDNGSTYKSTTYTWAGNYTDTGGTVTGAGSASDSKLYINLAGSLSGAVGTASSGTIKFSNPLGGTAPTQFLWHVQGGGGSNFNITGGGYWNGATTAINNIKFTSDAGNITGNFHLYALLGT